MLDWPTRPSLFLVSTSYRLPITTIITTLALGVEAYSLRTCHSAALPFAACLLPPAKRLLRMLSATPHVLQWRVSSRLLGAARGNRCFVHLLLVNPGLLFLVQPSHELMATVTMFCSWLMASCRGMRCEHRPPCPARLVTAPPELRVRRGYQLMTAIVRCRISEAPFAFSTPTPYHGTGSACPWWPNTVHNCPWLAALLDVRIPAHQAATTVLVVLAAWP